MAIISIFEFGEKDRSTEGRSVGAIRSSRYRLPILFALQDLGINSFHSNKRIEDYLGKVIKLEQADQVSIGVYQEWEYRLKWALNRLKNSGLVIKDPNQNSSWRISKEGTDFLIRFDLLETPFIEEERIEEVRREVNRIFNEKKREREGTNDRRYWALGFSYDTDSHSKLDDFIENNYWQALDYADDDTSRGAKTSRGLFLEIEEGDYALIKGHGGRADIRVYYVGKVVGVDTDTFRLEFEKLNVELYQGKAPSGAGAGNWWNTILEIHRPGDIQQLFFQYQSIQPKVSGQEQKRGSGNNTESEDEPGFYKYSYANLEDRSIENCINASIIVLRPFIETDLTIDSSDEKSSETFRKAPTGSYFYSCNKDKDVFILGKIVSGPEVCQINALHERGYQQRRYEIIRGTQKFDPYTVPEVYWSPASPDQMIQVLEEDFPEFDENVLIPYFGTRVEEVQNGQTYESGVSGAGQFVTIDRNSKAILDVDIIAQELIKVMRLMKGNTGQMLGVFGSWGRGKTFFVRQLCKRIHINYLTGYPTGESEYHFVKFHAWKYQDTEAIWAYLYEQISEAYFNHKNTDSELNKKPALASGFYKMLRKKINEFKLLLKLNGARHGYGQPIWILVSFVLFLLYHFVLKRLDFVKELQDSLQWTIGAIIASIGVTGLAILTIRLIKLGRKGKRVVRKYTERPTFNKYLGVQAEIQEELRYLLRAWIRAEYKKDKDGSSSLELAAGEKRLLIFVDDIDRCSEDKIIQVVDALRVMLEDEEIAIKVMVLAAIDEEILERAIHWKYTTLIQQQNTHIDQNQDEANEEASASGAKELVKEYMDKLFLGGVKLPPLSDKEKEQILQNYAEESDLTDKEELLNVSIDDLERVSSRLDITSEDQVRELFPDLDDIESQQEAREAIRELLRRRLEAAEMMASSQKLSDEELFELKQNAKILKNATPRQLRIFLYRFILAKNLVLAQSPSKPLTPQWSKFMISQIALKTVHGQDYKLDTSFLPVLKDLDEKTIEFTPKVLDIVVPY